MTRICPAQVASAQFLRYKPRMSETQAGPIETTETAPLPLRLWTALASHDRFSLTAGSLICIGIALWLANMLGIPWEIGRGGALLQQSSGGVAIGLAWVIILGGALVSSVVASHLHFDGGLFCGCVGLGALSLRMGPMRFALMSAESPGIYFTLAIELVLLYSAVAGTWIILHLLPRRASLPREVVEFEEPLDQKFLATAAHAMIMVVLLLLLSHTDDKKQTLAVVGISSYLAAMAAHHFVPTRPSAWFWIAPLLVGIVGYIGQRSHPALWPIGDAQGFFRALTRPTPLDYASMGPAGALLGYWTSQRWRRARTTNGNNAV
jgi:hypothetical protein